MLSSRLTGYVPSGNALGSTTRVPSRRLDSPGRMIIVGVVATVAVTTLLGAAQAVDFGVFNLRLRELNADHHFSVFGVVSLLAQLATAAASARRGMRTDRHRRAWLILAALVAGLVLIRGLTAYSAALLVVPLACVFGLLCWLTWRDSSASRAVVWTALILLMTSVLLHQVGVDADSSTASDYTWSYQIVSIVKHGTELAGWMLAAVGITAGALVPAPEVADDTIVTTPPTAERQLG
jgi:hypothetical protein